MDDLEISGGGESINFNFDIILNFLTENSFIILLVIMFIILIAYKYSKDEVSLANGAKGFFESLQEKVSRLYGRLWLNSNMEGDTFKTKVHFDEEEEDYDEELEYEEVDNEEDDNHYRNTMSI
jgi:hypothetical protein